MFTVGRRFPTFPVPYSQGDASEFIPPALLPGCWTKLRRPRRCTCFVQNNNASRNGVRGGSEVKSRARWRRREEKHTPAAAPVGVHACPSWTADGVYGKQKAPPTLLHQSGRSTTPEAAKAGSHAQRGLFIWNSVSWQMLSERANSRPL